MVLDGECGKLSVLSNQIIGQKGMTFADGQLKMKDGSVARAGKGETSSKTAEATYELVKEQGEMMKQMVQSVTSLCAALQGSFQRVESRLDKVEGKKKESSSKPFAIESSSDKEPVAVQKKDAPAAAST